MAAIAEELVFREPPRPVEDDDAPEVSVVEGPAGRETLALIEGTARPPRSRQSTIGYGDRISNAPGAKTPSQPAAKTPSRPAAKKPTLAPPPKPSRAPAAKATSVAPAGKAPSLVPVAKPSTPAPVTKLSSRAPAAKSPPPVAAVSPTIFEMLTFVVQGGDVASLASDGQRRRFVEEHLLHRVPGQSMTQVDRIDVTPWTVKDTVVVRVWCKI
jgi:hypothetical protein